MSMKFFSPKMLISAVLLVAILGVSVLQPEAIFADSHIDQACTAIGGCDNGESDIQSTLETIINIFSVLIGIAAVVMIIVGGFKYITSGGDSQKIASAKNTVIYAIIGLVIVALAQVIVHFVLANLLGSPSEGDSSSNGPTPV